MSVPIGSVSRRAALGSLLTSTALVAGVGRVRAQSLATGLVDFHAHFVPPFYVQAAEAAGQGPDGMPAWPSWSIEEHQWLLDLCGIEVAVLSLSSPGVHFGDDAAARGLAKRVNDEAAAIAARVPSRFRFLASLPLPDVEGAIAEWLRVRGASGCMGAIVLSNAGDLYPGASRFDALWSELNASGALVLLHPSSPSNWRVTSPSRPRPLLEFYFESARACLDLFRASVVERFPKLRIVIPHCGGALPMALDRVAQLASYDRSPVTALQLTQLRKLWFDVAGSPFETQVPTLLAHAQQDQLVYGSDWCFTPTLGVLAQLNSIQGAPPPLRGGTWLDALSSNGLALLR